MTLARLSREMYRMVFGVHRWQNLIIRVNALEDLPGLPHLMGSANLVVLESVKLSIGDGMRQYLFGFGPEPITSVMELQIRFCSVSNEHLSEFDITSLLQEVYVIFPRVTSFEIDAKRTEN